MPLTQGSQRRCQLLQATLIIRPFSYRNPDDRFIRIQSGFCQNAFALQSGSRIQRQHRICGDFHFIRQYAQPRQFFRRLLVPDGDQVRLITYDAGQQTHEPVADGTDPLGKEHNLFLFPFCRRNDRKIISQAPFTSHILQQAAAAADQQVCFADGAQQAYCRETVQRFDLMFCYCISRISGNNGYIRIRFDSAQRCQYGGQQRFVSGIIKSVISGNNDLTH